MKRQKYFFELDFSFADHRRKEPAAARLLLQGRPEPGQAGHQGSILQNSISAENVLDKVHPKILDKFLPKKTI
jgi:hypothetical protein